MNPYLISAPLLTLTILAGCGGGGGGSGNSGSDTPATRGDMTVHLLNSTLASAPAPALTRAPGIPTAQVSPQAAGDPIFLGTDLVSGPVLHNGTFIEARNVTGKVASISVLSSFGGGTYGPQRIIDLGGGSELATDQSGSIATRDFDYSDTTKTVENLDSEDTLLSVSEAEFRYNRVSLLLASLDTQIQIQAANAGAAEYWTIRHVFVTQPVLNDPAIDTCITDSAYRDALTNNGRLFATGPDFQKGDILVCIRTDSSACADTEFKFVDSTTGTLADSRPTDPVRYTGTYAINDSDCTLDGNGRPDMNLGGVAVEANIASPFLLTAELIIPTPDPNSTDPNAGNSLPSPYYEYTYTADCVATGAETGGCSGTPVTANNVDFTVGFHTDKFQDGVYTDSSVFAHTEIADWSTGLANVNKADILKHLDEMMFVPLYIKNNQTADGNGLDPRLDADITVDLF